MFLRWTEVYYVCSFSPVMTFLPWNSLPTFLLLGPLCFGVQFWSVVLTPSVYGPALANHSGLCRWFSKTSESSVLYIHKLNFELCTVPFRTPLQKWQMPHWNWLRHEVSIQGFRAQVKMELLGLWMAGCIGQPGQFSVSGCK